MQCSRNPSTFLRVRFWKFGARTSPNTGKDTPASESRQPSLMGSGEPASDRPRRGCRWTLHRRNAPRPKAQAVRTGDVPRAREMAGFWPCLPPRMPARRASMLTRFHDTRHREDTGAALLGMLQTWWVSKLQGRRKGGSHFLACRDTVSLHLFICVPQAPCPPSTL